MLEVKIEELTRVIEDLIHVIRTIEAGKTVDPVPSKPAPVKAPIETPAPAPVVQAAPVMPAAPTFEPIPQQLDSASAPFTDGKGLIDYVMTIYKELGPEKGAKIQGVLTEMGLQNVNELRPTEYDAFYSKVEALK